jgi:hypothetical protein
VSVYVYSNKEYKEFKMGKRYKWTIHGNRRIVKRHVKMHVFVSDENKLKLASQITETLKDSW